MALKKYKISFCIVCMNRLHQLIETLPRNIKDNEDYDELEYIVLDYNSQDGMEDWAKENLSEYIDSGKVIYYRTPDPQTFSHSHSKNMAFNLASGDIICSINADHYTGKGFADYVNNMYNDNDNIVLTTIDFHGTQKDYNVPLDVLGRVCVKKSDFLKIKGFDERMNRYGNEDYDFVNRLELAGVKRVFIKDFSFLNFISHSQEERYSLDSNPPEIYIRYSEPFASELLMMYEDGQFKSGLLIKNENLNSDKLFYAYKPRKHRYKLNIKDPGWQEGEWKHNLNDQSIEFFFNETNSTFRLEKNIINACEVLISKTEDKVYYALTHAGNIKRVVIFDYFFHNRSIMEKNLENRIIEVNDYGFGEGLLFKNFQSSIS